MAISADQFISSVATVDAAAFSDENERAKAVEAARRLLLRIETPWETTRNLVWGQPALSAALRTAVDVQFFEKWAALGAQPMSLSQLAELSGIDSRLLERLLSHMVSMGALNATPNGTYTMTHFSASLGDPSTGFSSAVAHLFDVNFPAFGNLPKFLSSQGLRNPSNPASTNWQDMSPSGESFFEFLAKNPAEMQHFQDTMRAYNGSKTPWVDIYPTEDLVNGAKPDRPTLVDVGGGQGHDIGKFAAKYPHLPAGSLVLQDLPATVQSLGPTIGTAIKVESFDFFTPQPIKGARAYYMHIILHDWPDVKAAEILRNIATAMERGYSKLLLHEAVVDPQNPHPQVTASDLTMMCAFSATERSVAMWSELAASAGLKVTRIVKPPSAIESVIELELA